jgi:diguanylate cyclase
VFRYGGEEFLVVLVESDAGVAKRVAETLRQRIESSAFALADGTAVHATASIGIAEHRGRPDYQPLLSAADAALYRAKRAGRNRVEA